MSGSAVAVSAPGKVLFAGGFLVLDRKHTGLVFGLNARIHIHVQTWAGDEAVVASDAKEKLALVRSPQFRDANWLYKIDPSKPTQDEAVSVAQITNNASYTQSRNKFVQITIQYVLTYLLHISKGIDQTIKVTIMADNDYYSQSAAASVETKNGFRDFGVTLSEAHKTGLGSSAALVASFVGALLKFYSGGKTIPHKTIHNLAQAAHCAAQGKVGSGFDVAAAVYGSCVYRRFSPSILEVVGDPSAPGFGERLHVCVDDLNLDHAWDVEVSSQAVKIPDSLLLMMCDVDCGSETPGMVRMVLQWRKEKQAEANFLWNSIQQGMNDLCGELGRSSQVQGGSSGYWKEIADIIATIRSFVKDMSRKSDVPIEPDVITELLDYCTELPGVVGGVAPGAGGYDAVSLLVRNDSETVRDLQDRLEHWSSKGEHPGATIGKVRLLDVRQAYEGIRVQDAGRYGQWVE